MCLFSSFFKAGKKFQPPMAWLPRETDSTPYLGGTRTDCSSGKWGFRVQYSDGLLAGSLDCGRRKRMTFMRSSSHMYHELEAHGHDRIKTS